MNEAEQAQKEVAEATGQVVGLAADLVGVAANALRGPDKRNFNQNPAIPSLDDGDRDLKAQANQKGVDVVLDKTDPAPSPIPEKAQQKSEPFPSEQPDAEQSAQTQSTQSQEEKAQADTPVQASQNTQTSLVSEPPVSEVLLDETQYRDSLKAQGIGDEIIDVAIEEMKQSGNPPDSQESERTRKVEQTPEPKAEQKPVQPKVEQSEPTASTFSKAKSEVKALGQSIETQLKDILKADKVEARIYSGNRLVYPPDSKTNISPEMSDKLNRAFSDTQSVKGTITLSLRGDDGKLNPIYKVSKGKVVQDDYGLRKAIAQSLPEAQKANQKVEQQPVQQPETQKSEQQSVHEVQQPPEQKVEQQPVQQPETQKSEQQSEQLTVQKPESNSIERQNEINQSNTQQRVRRPTPDEIIGRQSQRIKAQQVEITSLKSQLAKSQKLEAKLRKAKVPNGIVAGLQKHTNRLGDRLKNRVNAVQAKAAEKVRSTVSVLDNKLADVESNTVYRAAAYLAKEHGQKQGDGSQQFTANHRFNIHLKEDGNLTISRANEDKATLFSGNQHRSRFTKAARLNELNQVKSLPLAVGRIRQEQQKASHTQKQTATQQKSRGMGRKR